MAPAQPVKRSSIVSSFDQSNAPVFQPPSQPSQSPSKVTTASSGSAEDDANGTSRPVRQRGHSSIDYGLLDMDELRNELKNRGCATRVLPADVVAALTAVYSDIAVTARLSPPLLNLLIECHKGARRTLTAAVAATTARQRRALSVRAPSPRHARTLRTQARHTRGESTSSKRVDRQTASSSPPPAAGA
jgi:hypothetical protein